MFYLDKILNEIYHKYYIPYFNINEAARIKGREVKAKGNMIHPSEDEYQFILDVQKQIPTKKRVAASKILMVYYNLLGSVHTVLERPNQPQGDHSINSYKKKANPAFAWINSKSEPDANGISNVSVTFQTSGGEKGKKTAHVKVNMKALKDRLKQAGYDANDPKVVEGIIKTDWRTWQKRVDKDPNAPEGAERNFVIKPFNSDYHANQADIESPDFNNRIKTDAEFRDSIQEKALKAASRIYGIGINTQGGWKYTVTSQPHNASTSDMEDAAQAGIMNLSKHAAINPDQLNDEKWVNTKLYSGAKKHWSKSLQDSKHGLRGSGMEDDDDNRRNEIPDRSDDYSSGSMDEPDTVGSEDPDEFATSWHSKVNYGDIPEMQAELKSIKTKLKDMSIQGDRRKELMRRGMELETDIEKAQQDQDAKKSTDLINRYNRPVVAPKPKPVVKVADVQPNAYSYSSHDDDDVASADDLLKYRRRMKAEGLTFENYFKFKEMLGATSAIYDGKKGKDFQWEGNPKSMRKKK
jgi:hypothetical protein